MAAPVEFTVVERRGARSEAEQAMVEVERERERGRDRCAQRLWMKGEYGTRIYIEGFFFLENEK